MKYPSEWIGVAIIYSFYTVSVAVQESGWPVLVVVCKRPALGVGKQRLAAHLGAEAAYHIAEALLACVMEDVACWQGSVVIAPAFAADYDWALSLFRKIHSAVTVLPQIAGNLGQRLNGLDATLRCKGLQQLVYIGSDAPGLNAIDFLAVKNTLQQNDTVFIPAIDGGVTLMANRQPWPDLTTLPWSTNQLGTELVKICQQSGYTVQQLKPGFDVDELDDLKALKQRLAGDQRPARKQLCTLAHQILGAKS